MIAAAIKWSEVAPDFPIAKLSRQLVQGSQMLLANVRLEKGCVVALHQHVSEQMAIVLSGHVMWTVGADTDPDQQKIEMRGGEVMRLPGNVWHGVEALEDTHIIDVLSPPGAMGVDSQKD
jgi:quercetin dioxygenase-like cupin family protein